MGAAAVAIERGAASQISNFGRRQKFGGRKSGRSNFAPRRPERDARRYALAITRFSK
jgi:hypothetical protein